MNSLLPLNQLFFLFLVILFNVTLHAHDISHEEDFTQNTLSIIVSIKHDDHDKNNSTRDFCVGTILSESYILTAASCVSNLLKDALLTNVMVTVNLYKESDWYQVIRKIDEIFIHPQWINNQHHQNHNIAILHFSTPVDSILEKYITRLYPSQVHNEPNDVLQYPLKTSKLIAIEWDHMIKYFKNQKLPGAKPFEVALVDHEDPVCQKLISNSLQQFCTLFKNTCNHKLGEPILQWIDDRWIQVGLLSSVVEEVNIGCIGIYTRLTFYHEWINSITNKKNLKDLNLEKNDDLITSDPITYNCNSLPLSCGCGKNNVILSQGRILDGEEAVPLSWTMVVSVRFNDSVKYSCGGSILTPYYIITSAYCVDGISKLDMSIAAGIHDLVDDFPTVRYVQDIFIHPQWNRSDDTYQNDIALLNIFPPLSIPSPFGVTRTCVSYSSSKNETINYPPNGAHLAIVGWGPTNSTDNDFSNTLQQASIYATDNNDVLCQQTIGDVEKQFCARVNGKRPCTGDLGGPVLQWKGHYWEQVGIISHSEEGDFQNSTCVFTRLAYYVDWMESIINTSLTTTTARPRPPPILYNCNKTSSCGCGEADVILTPTRIVGGENAIENSWPMIVSLRLFGTSSHSCGGTILSSSYILTAAHCFRNVLTEHPIGVTVAAGMTNRSDPLQIIRNVDRIYVHPNFTGLPDDYRHDIAIIHIDQPFILESNPNLRRTCLSRTDSSISADEYPSAGSRLVTIGWGTLHYGVQFIPEFLQQVEVFAIDNQDPTCLNAATDTEFLFCAGLFEGGKDSCKGDSGGPILQWAEGYWEQVGIVSNGNGCAQAGFPGLYTRLSKYYDWIQEIINNDYESSVSSIVPTTATLNNTWTTITLDITSKPTASNNNTWTITTSNNPWKTTASNNAAIYKCNILTIMLWAFVLVRCT